MSIATNVEVIWAKITPTHGEPIAIGSFYRPPDNNADSIEDFKTAHKYINFFFNHIIFSWRLQLVKYNLERWHWTNCTKPQHMVEK